MERLFTVAEVMEQTGLTKSLLYQAIRKGELLSVRLGRENGKGIRLRASDVDAWVASKASGVGTIG